MQRERNDFMNFLLGDNKINVKDAHDYSQKTRDLEKKLDHSIKKKKKRIEHKSKVLDNFKMMSNMSKAKQALSHKITMFSELNKDQSTPKQGSRHSEISEENHSQFPGPTNVQAISSPKKIPGLRHNFAPS